MNGDFGLISVPVGIGAATLGGSAIYYGVKVRGVMGACTRVPRVYVELVCMPSRGLDLSTRNIAQYHEMIDLIPDQGDSRSLN